MYTTLVLGFFLASLAGLIYAAAAYNSRRSLRVSGMIGLANGSLVLLTFHRFTGGLPDMIIMGVATGIFIFAALCFFSTVAERGRQSSGW